MTVHIANPFASAFGGSERAALALYEGLRARCDVQLWCEGRPDARLDAPIRLIDEAAGAYPVGGTLVLAGNFFWPGRWLERAWPERAILSYNKTVRPELKYALIDRLRRLGEPEIVYVSRPLRDWVAIPGTVFPSLIDPAQFAPSARPADGRFVLGRLSRDDPTKHHAFDPALYRRLASQGVDVRVMGGTCLAAALDGAPRVELLPAGAEPAARFLQGLDCFFYRTSTAWTEAGGRVVAEAMACGLPVVCHRNGGYDEWIEHGVSGFLFERDDEAERVVLELKNNPELRRRIRAAARASMERLFSGEAREAYFDFFAAPRRAPTAAARSGKRVDFAWELGGHTGHVTTLLPIVRALAARGHPVRYLLRDAGAGADLDGMAGIAREQAPIWVGPIRHENPLNFGEILINFGYQDPVMLRQLIEAWRERLAGTGLVVANVAPAAHIAARTLGIPSLEISQGFHIPPPAMPAPPLRDWEPAPRARLEEADRSVLAAINRVFGANGVPPLETIGELFAGRALLLTYPELDIYPERGAAEYFGIPRSGEGSALPPWPKGRGPRVFSYLYSYCPGLERLLDALASLDYPTLMLCRGVDERLRAKHAGGPVHLAAEPMAASRLLKQAELVISHGSHQMTAQTLLAGKPLLMLPTQLEQFLTTRRVVRFGAGLGIAPGTPDADFESALAELAQNPGYGAKAREFARRYAGHDRDAALATIVARCEAALAAGGVQTAAISSGQRSGSKTES